MFYSFSALHVGAPLLSEVDASLALFFAHHLLASVRTMLQEVFAISAAHVQAAFDVATHTGDGVDKF